MATYRWTGVVSGAWPTAGNWSPSGPPGVSDIALFDNVTTNLTSGPGSPVNLSEVILTPRYTGNFGASGAEILNLSASMLTAESQGQLWWGNTTVSLAVINPRSTNANAVNFIDTNLGDCRFVSGRTTLTSCVLGNLMVIEIGDDAPVTAPEVIFNANCVWNNFAQVYVNAGVAHFYDGPSGALTDEFINVGGGVAWMRGGTTDHVKLHSGTVRHDSGTITRGIMSGGTWDSTEGADDRTLTQLFQFGGESLFQTSGSQGKPGSFIYLGGRTTLPANTYTL